MIEREGQRREEGTVRGAFGPVDPADAADPADAVDAVDARDEDDEEGTHLLLGHAPRGGAGATAAGSTGAKGTSLWQEVASQLGIALPTAIGNATEYLPVVTAMAIVGHLPPEEDAGAGGSALYLDAMGLGRAYFNMTAMAPLFGLTSALRTLCPQAIGAGKPRMVAAYVQQSVLLCLAAAPLCCGIQWQCAKALVWMGQSKAIAAMAQAYAVRLVPMYFGLLFMTVLQRVMQAHNRVWENLAICALVGATAPFLQGFLCRRLGYIGAAYASGIVNCLYVFLQVPYLLSKRMGYLFVPTGAAVDAVQARHFLSLTVPGFLAGVLEWWILEVVVFLAGMLRDEDITVAATSITTNIQAMLLMGWIGLLVASSVRVGHQIGAGDVRAAKQSAAAAIGLALAFGAAAFAVLWRFAWEISGLYSADASLRRLVALALRCVSFVVVVDVVNNVMQGAMSGVGAQKASAFAQLAGYYVFGTPLGAFLAFSDAAFGGSRYGVMGLWIGIGTAMLTSASFQLHFLRRPESWKRAVREARERLRCDSSLVHAAASAADGL